MIHVTPRAKPVTDGKVHGKHRSLRHIPENVQVEGRDIKLSEAAGKRSKKVCKEINAGGTETVESSETLRIEGNMSVM